MNARSIEQRNELRIVAKQLIANHDERVARMQAEQLERFRRTGEPQPPLEARIGESALSVVEALRHALASGR